MSQLRKATRQKAKIRLGISGPSGSGKTYTALLIAYGITNDWTRIAVIDSENGSADLYENLGDYNVLPINAPYTPEKYIDAIQECENAGMEVIIIDSITHEWSGKGGCLEIHENVVKNMRNPNSYTAWAEVTPRHQAFIDAVLQSKCHIITTVRSKTEYVMTERNGKQVPQKMGMAAVTREGFEYELTLSFEMDVEHKAFVGKDRTGLFMGNPAFIPTIQTGEQIKQWCESGLDVSQQVTDAIEKLDNCEEPSDVIALKNILPSFVQTNESFKQAANNKYKQLKTQQNEPATN